jgi:hypothetical protein
MCVCMCVCVMCELKCLVLILNFNLSPNLTCFVCRRLPPGWLCGGGGGLVWVMYVVYMLVVLAVLAVWVIPSMLVTWEITLLNVKMLSWNFVGHMYI